MKTHLLCTFTQKEELDNALEFIASTYVLPENKIFVFTNDADDNELFCTYNVSDVAARGRYTILMHRKKESNTLYTVNALNGLIRTLNNGILDKSFAIDWQQYRNSILLYNDDMVKQIQLQLYKIVRL